MLDLRRLLLGVARVGWGLSGDGLASTASRTAGRRHPKGWHSKPYEAQRALPAWKSVLGVGEVQGCMEARSP